MIRSHQQTSQEISPRASQQTSHQNLQPRPLVVMVVLLVAAVAGGAAAALPVDHAAAQEQQQPPEKQARPAPDLSRKLAQFVYIEEGTDLIFTVGVRAAALREGEPFFPLEVSLTNKEKKTTWKVSRESFVLFDEDGQRYEMPTQPELQEGYHKRTPDTRLFTARSFTAGKHEGYRQVESNFFPDPVVGVLRTADTSSGPEGVASRSTSLTPIETVELTYRSFLEDVLYFPRPAGELIGQRLSLEFRAAGLEEPARIAFRIPRIVRKR